jgi:hypothetical protein
MDWTFALIGFALAVFMGSALVSLLTTVRPEWSRRRRRLIAASTLPAITAVATLLGLLFLGTSSHGASRHTEELAMKGIVMIGGGFTLIAWVGGLVGATLASRRRG